MHRRHPTAALQQAFAFNLIIHELATNAAKYGALSRYPRGGSRSTAGKSEEQTGIAIFRWTERGGPPATPP